jgi:hypothetical protein
VDALNQEYVKLREELNSPNNLGEEWLEKKMRLSELRKQIMAAKENAFNDIYERVNSTGSMGISLAGQNTTIDLHGQSVEAAKRFINDPILPVLPVLKKIMVITGRGLNSANGEGVLKPALKTYLTELNVKYEDVEGNQGAIFIFA